MELEQILSIAKLVIGIAAASTSREPIVLAALAGLVAGALSMAVGDYIKKPFDLDRLFRIIRRNLMPLGNMQDPDMCSPVS